MQARLKPSRLSHSVVRGPRVAEEVAGVGVIEVVAAQAVKVQGAKAAAEAATAAEEGSWAERCIYLAAGIECLTLSASCK